MIDLWGKILLLSPHMDDEILGCGGFISNLMKNNDTEHLHIHYFNDKHPLFEKNTLIDENNKLISKIGCTSSVSELKNTNKLDQVPIAEHINEIEHLINSNKPDTILVTFPSYNQDHRHVFEATITATRPHDRNYYVKNILLYEQPETIQTNRIEPRFIPNAFIPIDIHSKCELYGIYVSQLRGHRTFDHLKALAELRGMQCNVSYAESYMLIRLMC